MVLQSETSQVFSSAILMKTSDGGLSWQTYDLPAVSKLEFSSPTDGWLQNDLSGELYRTFDGGVSWQPAPVAKYPFSLLKVPEGTTLSGWQTDDLGWSVTSQGSCSAEKFSDSATCQVDSILWQTLDGGKNWEPVPMPNVQ